MTRAFAAAVLLVAIACSGAFASEPGQPLDCSDWVFIEPGLSCRVVAEECGQAVPLEMCSNSPGKPADNAGGVLWIRQVGAGLPACPGGQIPIGRVQVSRILDGVPTVVAYIQDRCGLPGSLDQVGMVALQDGYAAFEGNYGRLLLGIQTRSGSSPFAPHLVALEGFTTTFDVLQTYTPASSLGFRVPYMPEGMAGADHFDTYWGALAKPLDFTQAHPLQCDYPSTTPAVGDYLTIADTVPTPAPGQGVYYVTAATYQGATRYGRKASNGQLSGRDPALLPACTP